MKEQELICKDCNGHGLVSFDHDYVTCAICNGKGKIDVSETQNNSPVDMETFTIKK